MVSINITRWPYLERKHEGLSTSTIGHVSLGISIVCASTFNGFAKTLGTALGAFSLVVVSEMLNFLFTIFSFGFLPTAKRVLSLRKKELIPLICIGCISGVIAPVLWFTGLSATTAINASMFSKAEVIFLLMMAHFTLGEQITRGHFIALFTIIGGMLFVTLSGFTESLQQLHIGDVIILLSTVCYGSSNIIYRKFIPHLEPFLPMFVRSMCALTAFFTISSFTTIHVIDEILALPMELIPALIGFAFISRFLSSILYYQAIEYVPISTVSLISTLDIIGSTLFAYLYLGESVEWYHYAGGSLIILGNLLLSYFNGHMPLWHHFHFHFHHAQPEMATKVRVP